MAFEFEYTAELKALEKGQMMKNLPVLLISFVVPWICLGVAMVILLLMALAAMNKTPFVGIILMFVMPLLLTLMLYRVLGGGQNSTVKKIEMDDGKFVIKFTMPFLSKTFLPGDIHEIYMVPKKSLVPTAVEICEKNGLFPFYLYYFAGGRYGGPSKTRYLLFLPAKNRDELLSFKTKTS